MTPRARHVRTLAALALALFAALSIASCGDGDEASGGDRAPTTDSGMAVVGLRAPGGELRVEVARTTSERTLGLSGRDALTADTGMLFDLGETRRATFIMRGMRFALDMVWIDAGRRVTGVTADVPPAGTGETGPPYSSPGEVRYVLEVAAGVARELGIAEGAQLDFTLP